MAKLIEFETSRLRLRQWREVDRYVFAALNADPRVMEFFPAPLSRAASDALMDRCQSLIAQRGYGLWAVELIETRELIGFVGLHVPAPDLPFSPCVEIGWRIAFQYWNKGFATEAADSVLRVGFECLGLHEIVSFTTVNNRRSRAVMEKLGMQLTDTFNHPHVPATNPLRPHCLYRLGREQWAVKIASVY